MTCAHSELGSGWGGPFEPWMFWHAATQVVSLVVFASVAWVRWHDWYSIPSARARVASAVAALLLAIGSAIGGYIVYHGGAGVAPQLLDPSLGGHDHERQRHEP